MITFPPEFVTTKYPGYFWNTVTKRLFSIKVSGELRELQFQKANRWNNHREGYRVSVKGEKRILTLEYLKTLHSQIIPVVSKELFIKRSK